MRVVNSDFSKIELGCVSHTTLSIFFSFFFLPRRDIHISTLVNAFLKYMDFRSSRPLKFNKFLWGLDFALEENAYPSFLIRIFPQLLNLGLFRRRLPADASKFYLLVLVFLVLILIS